MAGGLHIFGTPKDGMHVINVEHDTEWDLMQIAERFEVPYLDFNRASDSQKLAYIAMLEVKSKAVGKKAIETYTRLKHWKFYDKRPVELDLSAANIDLDPFRTSRDIVVQAADQGSGLESLGTIAYVLKMWFVVQKIRVEVIKPEVDDEDVTDGLVNPHKIDGYLTSKNEEIKNNGKRRRLAKSAT